MPADEEVEKPPRGPTLSLFSCAGHTMLPIRAHYCRESPRPQSSSRPCMHTPQTLTMWTRSHLWTMRRLGWVKLSFHPLQADLAPPALQGILDAPCRSPPKKKQRSKGEAGFDDGEPDNEGDDEDGGSEESGGSEDEGDDVKPAAKAKAAPKAKAKAKAKASAAAPKASAAAPKAKAKAKGRPKKQLSDEQKSTMSRKSAAYHRAVREAREAGCTHEEQRARGRAVS